ncbi:MAG: lipopolysaccharide biosynthesis protein, partial [Candidatus Aminicenantes bacterium]
MHEKKMTLRQKTINGLKWSFVDSFANQGFQFIIGIILARLLVPKDFGLIGMLIFFIAISQSFIDSGFSQALIRKKDCKQVDFNTAFFFNLLVGIVFYLVLFFSADLIAGFFGEPQLFSLIRVLGLVLLINAFGLIQRTILIKEINFKLQTKISLIASFISGAVGIGMALNGFGVWSLVYKTIILQLTTTFLFWLWNKWKPTATFSVRVFKDLFQFGSKLLASGLIDTIYQNIYYLIIGKYFSAADLGYYTRADEFRKIPSQNLYGIIGRVSY